MNLKKKQKQYKWTYLQNKNRLTDIENKLIVTRGERKGGINWDFGINRYRLLCIKHIDKDLLCSTGNDTQYLIITYKGKESDKE